MTNTTVLNIRKTTEATPADVSLLLNNIADDVETMLAGVQVKVASGAISATAGQIVSFQGSSGQTLTLPTAVVGMEFEIINIDTSDSVTISRNGTDTISSGESLLGLSSFVLPFDCIARVRCVASGTWRATIDGAVAGSVIGSPTALADGSEIPMTNNGTWSHRPTRMPVGGSNGLVVPCHGIYSVTGHLAAPSAAAIVGFGYNGASGSYPKIYVGSGTSSGSVTFPLMLAAGDRVSMFNLSGAALTATLATLHLQRIGE